MVLIPIGDIIKQRKQRSILLHCPDYSPTPPSWRPKQTFSVSSITAVSVVSGRLAVFIGRFVSLHHHDGTSPRRHFWKRLLTPSSNTYIGNPTACACAHARMHNTMMVVARRSVSRGRTVNEKIKKRRRSKRTEQEKKKMGGSGVPWQERTTVWTSYISVCI